MPAQAYAIIEKKNREEKGTERLFVFAYLFAKHVRRFVSIVLL